MKKLIRIFLGSLLICGTMLIWLSEKTSILEAQTATISVPRGYELSTGWIVLDGANATTTTKLTFMDSYGQNLAAWGSFCLWVRADTIAAGSAEDSLLIWYKVLKADTSLTSYYDSTSLTSNFDWATGKLKVYTLSPDVCYGLEFRVTNTTTVDDSIQFKLDLVYQ